ncbi:hypothetical protein Tco_1087669 [Tanacetum coccineum]
MNRSDIQKNLYNTLIESYNSDKDLFASYGDVVTLKRGHDDQDKDEEPSAGSNRGTKQRRSGKEESSKNQLKRSPSLQVLPKVHPDLNQNYQAMELEYHLEEVFKATNDQLDWLNPEGRPYPHDLSKPLPLIQNARGKLTNLNLDERFALNVALRMYTRHIAIQERVEDLQLFKRLYTLAGNPVKEILLKLNLPDHRILKDEGEVTRPRKYFELSATDAIQANCDVKATNIILQGLPPEVYALVSNHRISKELWERIQLLMQGNSLTK